MSANKFKDHLIIIPEDDANRQIATGFQDAPAIGDAQSGQIQIAPEVGGWEKVSTVLLKSHISGLCKYPKRSVLLLIDFDVEECNEEKKRIKIKKRRAKVIKDIPKDLLDRVFVLGVLDEPENLVKAKNSPNSFEDIGKALAQDCFDGTDHTWKHELLKHNKDELARLEKAVKPFLFPVTNNS